MWPEVDNALQISHLQLAGSRLHYSLALVAPVSSAQNTVQALREMHGSVKSGWASQGAVTTFHAWEDQWVGIKKE